MIAMIFEYWFDPAKPEVYDEYLREAAELRSHLADVAGFRGVERFQSCVDPSKFMAVGFFDDEGAVADWRNRSEHRRVQALGRGRFFTDYRLRMAEVTRDYGPNDREQAPADSRRAHDPAAKGSMRDG